MEAKTAATNNAAKTLQPIRFKGKADADFVRTLRKRVNAYFSENKISKYGNTEMYIKTVCMLSIYLVPYILMMTGVVTNHWAIFASWIVMGVGTAGIGFSVMHDANHGAYSQNQKVNNIIGLVLNLLGGLATNWKIQHNVLHHTYTNIDGYDDDINPGKLLRFSPHKPRYNFHKYQHIYGWLLYGLMTIMWITAKDIKQLVFFYNKGLMKSQNINNINLFVVKLVALKVAYYTVFLTAPIMVIDAPNWLIVTSFISMHFVAGFILGIVFQPAHVSPETEFPLPDDKGQVERDWLVHQLYTTTNFAPKAKSFGWFVGGLNYQIEHHLFPNICHVHYKHLSPIVEATAKEYGLPYYSQPTFWVALKQHGKMLKDLGTKG